MPKSTFLNLPNEKKQRLIEILLENFSARHISQVKVADIVEDMAMSRGAFYKYFEDLEDAYTYTIQYYSIQIHRDILKYISQNKQDFFQGIENYLAWCSELEQKSSYWQAIRFLTRSDDFTNHQRTKPSAESGRLKEWFKLLKANGFHITSEEEAISFLYFVMGLVINSLTDYIANDWTTDELLQDYRYKVKWLQRGLNTERSES
ncbi:TetR/AcrR family transcriptional regulator [Enterococcus hirae 57-03-H11]|uniref:TetR/AcrR family transcriptional regulator n=1 Tax=Enterococcus TaxID=1350 RepID=UPI000B53AEB1|nr:TetR/AcrR family transcriptional regulator [Enterococcus hirae]OWW64343.1 TetR/AcrR family transcriptional regulator [Enterococcus hirae 57-03-H11]EMF0059609.1 TetR/AcrR family transcriptional regulator [Enterococcus hirae]EMF0180937.1 TetR/AcrR family transcriptional regulator [Enterococcus hirae]EMF0197155.1 TetR/AcrR family transcriptional regulator [Enterococcus hirae]EMF0462083.1 TetR/AcrR family transcriptional regulator [Enterococcus hirae]